jgi:hypothetical protein
MAKVEMGGAPNPSSAGIGNFVNILGGVASVALIIGVGIWGYRTLTRDVSGVPVIRASGELRMAPDDPGGRMADNMGLAVNRVAANGMAEKPADRLVLAPSPVALRREDQPLAQITPIARPEPKPVARQAVQSTRTEREPAPRDTAQSDQIIAPRPIDALTESLLAGATPLSNETVDLGRDNAASRALAAAQAQNTETTPRFRPENPALPLRSMRPVKRPANLARAVKAVVATQTTPGGAIAAPAPINVALGTAPVSDPLSASAIATGLEVPIENVAAGTRLAQLGAYDSPEVARKEWDRFAIRFRDYMGDKQRVIQQASSGGRTFYRLRVMGFSDLSEARHFCAALVADKVDCIPVVMK